MEPQAKPPELKNLQKEANDQNTQATERKAGGRFFGAWKFLKGESTTNGETAADPEKTAKDKERIAAKFANMGKPSAETTTPATPPEKSRLKQYQETQAQQPAQTEDLPTLDSLTADIPEAATPAASPAPATTEDHSLLEKYRATTAAATEPAPQVATAPVEPARD